MLESAVDGVSQSRKLRPQPIAATFGCIIAITIVKERSDVTVRIRSVNRRIRSMGPRAKILECRELR